LFFLSAAHSAQDVDLTATAFKRALTRLQPSSAS
jgi:glutamate-1-semialdehyde aminotransferase